MLNINEFIYIYLFTKSKAGIINCVTPALISFILTFPYLLNAYECLIDFDFAIDLFYWYFQY